jgi:hypothetical protein
MKTNNKNTIAAPYKTGSPNEHQNPLKTPNRSYPKRSSPILHKNDAGIYMERASCVNKTIKTVAP